MEILSISYLLVEGYFVFLVVTYRRSPASFFPDTGALIGAERRMTLMEVVVVFMTLLLLAIVVCKRK